MSSPTPFKIDMAVEDNGPIQFYLESLFQSAGNEHRGGADMVREYMFRAFEHQDPNKSKVFLVTRLNRVLEIPREATLPRHSRIGVRNHDGRSTGRGMVLWLKMVGWYYL